MTEQNKISWQKCKDCEFLKFLSGAESIAYRCEITEQKLYLTSCVKNEHGCNHR